MRMRFRFTKLGKVRWTSHRDLAHMWERAFRRVQLPLAYTQGFSPRPKVSFGLALPTGAESVAEYLDVELAPERAPSPDAASPARITPALPTGIDVVASAVLAGGGDSLQEAVTSSSWTIETAGAGHDELLHLVQQALAAHSIVITRERKGRTADEDVRRAILSCSVDGTRLDCELTAHPRTLRPSELLRAIDTRPDTSLEAVAVRRTHQWIERDGARREPLPLDAPGAPHALFLADADGVRAS